MKSHFLRRGLIGAVLIAAHALAPAASFGGIDLNSFSFDVLTADFNASGSTPAATGTSNGIGWSLSATALWSGRTVSNGSFSFAALPLQTDNLHPSIDYTITFAQPIAKLLVALSNDNTNDSINFGLLPSLYQGVSINGTQITLNSASGGLVLFENVNSLTISNIDNNGITDGYDLAFHAVAAVPEPGSVVLMLGGLGLLVRRRLAMVR